MQTTFRLLLIMVASTLLAVAACGQTGTARDVVGPSPLVPIPNEPPPRLIVDPPLPEPLASGRVFIQYRVENMRMVPVFGADALDVSPRIGHVHITVDDLPWHFVDASGGTVVLVPMPPGPHTVLFELADPTHRVITSESVRFVVPAPAEASAPPAPRREEGPK